MCHFLNERLGKEELVEWEQEYCDMEMLRVLRLVEPTEEGKVSPMGDLSGIAFTFSSSQEEVNKKMDEDDPGQKGQVDEDGKKTKQLGKVMTMMKIKLWKRIVVR